MFFVQGEGRGHLSQAIAMKEILENQGHQIVSLIYGKKVNRTIPDYLFTHFNDKICFTDSPSLLRDKSDTKTLMVKSLFNNLIKSFYYIRQLKIINQEIKEKKPHLIFNFHEMMCGFYLMFYQCRIPVLSVARQYFYYHHRFRFSSKSLFNLISLQLVNYFTTYGSVKRLGINFSQFDNLKAKRLAVIPPLIRQKIRNSSAQSENQVLIYLLNTGYLKEVIDFHEEYPQLKKVCFWERESLNKEENLVFRKIDEDEFYKELVKSKAVMSNAGFDLIAECFYLGIPMLIIPALSHPEQFINSIESSKVGAAIVSQKFDNNLLTKFTNNYKTNISFKKWVNSCPELISIEIQKLIDKNLIQ